MKTMKDFTTFCTVEQTRRAWNLGAPIEKLYSVNFGLKLVRITPEHEGSFYGVIPTTQQMIAWLEFVYGLNIYPVQYADRCYYASCCVFTEKGVSDVAPSSKCASRLDAELTAIDAALDYVENVGNHGNV